LPPRRPVQPARAANALRGIAPRRLSRWWLLLGLVYCVGCAAIPTQRAVVDSVELEGNAALSAGDVTKKLATQPSPRFLGLMQGVVYDYRVFDRYVLQRDLERVERYYQARGYYRARARAGRIQYSGKEHVEVTIVVDEGPLTRVGRLDLFGLDGLAPALVARLRDAATEACGERQPFDEQVFQDTEATLRKILTDNGYAYAVVRRAADVDLPRSYASVRFDIEAKLLTHYGKISIVDLGPLPERAIRRALDLKPGAPYSSSELEAAQQAVLDLGVVSNVEIKPQLSDPPQATVPLTVKLQPSKLHQLRLGGGAQIDAIRTDLHLLAGWDHHDFLGDLRKLSLEARPGAVFYPTRFPTFQTPKALLPELKTRAELTQPGFLEARTNGSLRTSYNIYAALLSPDVDESAPVLGYRELEGRAGVDRALWKFYVRPSYNLGLNTPFTYIGQLDPDLGQVVVSFVELFFTLDLRDDRVSPHEGLFVANTLQFAGGPLGGDAQDLKLQPELRFYVPLGGELTFATRGSLGFIFARNYGDTIKSNAQTGGPPAGTSRADWVRDIQLGFFRSFFSGGPSSNRGYNLRGIGPHGVVPFYSPELAAADLDARCQQSPSDARCRLPLGGLSLWELSAELRVALAGALSMATFCDTSDVAPEQVQLRFDRPHLSCGLGLRYSTPVGPLRGDVGYRVPGLQTLGDDSGEGPTGTILGAPIAVSIAIGEAF